MPLHFLEKPANSLAWQRFLEMGFPDKANEVYRYVRMKELYHHPFINPCYEPVSYIPEASKLVFVNGHYSEALSMPPTGVIALPMSKAVKTYSSFLSVRENKWMKEEKDPFAMLNAAFSSEGLFLYIPAKLMLEQPIHIFNLGIEKGKPAHLCPRIHCFSGKYSSVQIILEHPSFGTTWVNAFMECTLEEGASLTIMKVGEESKKGHHLWALRANLKKESSLKTFSITNGNATSREDYWIALQGEKAEAILSGVWNVKESCQHHVNLWIDHQEANTTSLQKFKGILADSGRSSFEGKIYVHSNAQKTQAYQMNRNLILGEKAMAFSKPNLEIHADDVKASHGATVGHINPEDLFYLTSRSIPRPVAESLLLYGFGKEIIDLIPNSWVKEKALQVIR